MGKKLHQLSRELHVFFLIKTLASGFIAGFIFSLFQLQGFTAILSVIGIVGVIGGILGVKLFTSVI